MVAKNQDIEEVTKCCDVCLKNCSTPASPALACSSTGTRLGLHINYASPHGNRYSLVDAFSKFLDVHVTKTITSAATVELVKNSCCNYGLPDIVGKCSLVCIIRNAAIISEKWC